MKVVICGSTSESQEQINWAANFFESKGCTVTVPSLIEGNLINKKQRYLNKIDEADLVVIIPKNLGGVPSEVRIDSLLYTFGESTGYEYLYAIHSGTPTVIWDHPNFGSDFKPSISKDIMTVGESASLGFTKGILGNDSKENPPLK